MAGKPVHNHYGGHGPVPSALDPLVYYYANSYRCEAAVVKKVNVKLH